MERYLLTLNNFTRHLRYDIVDMISYLINDAKFPCSGSIHVKWSSHHIGNSFFRLVRYKRCYYGFCLNYKWTTGKKWSLLTFSVCFAKSLTRVSLFMITCKRISQQINPIRTYSGSQRANA